MNNERTWISDVREGLKELNKGVSYYYNDLTDNQRRIKFFTENQEKLGFEELTKLQGFIEKRRPELNVFVKDWTRSAKGPWSYGGPTYCVYYKPKVQI